MSASATFHSAECDAEQRSLLLHAVWPHLPASFYRPAPPFPPMGQWEPGQGQRCLPTKASEPHSFWPLFIFSPLLWRSRLGSQEQSLHPSWPGSTLWPGWEREAREGHESAADGSGLLPARLSGSGARSAPWQGLKMVRGPRLAIAGTACSVQSAHWREGRGTASTRAIPRPCCPHSSRWRPRSSSQCGKDPL